MSFKRTDRIVIIGGNTAGLSAALAVRRAGDKRPLTIIEKNPYIAVGRCSIPYLLGEDPYRAEELIRRDPQKFAADNSLELLTGAEVTGITPASQLVHYEHEEIKKEINYSELLIATGSRPFVPVSFSAFGEIFTLTGVEDLVRLNLNLSDGMDIAVLGGGPVGVETAYQLVGRGYEVTLFEMRDILPPLTRTASRSVVSRLSEAGVKVIEQTEVEEVEKTSGGFNLRASGSLHQFDIVIGALGFRPRTDFLTAPELNKKDGGSIPVDRQMRTGLPDVYAAGDVVARPACKGKLRWPLASAASIDGWVAGMNIASQRQKRQLELARMGFALGDESYARTGRFPLTENIEWHELKTSFTFGDKSYAIRPRLGVENGETVVAAEIVAGGKIAAMLLDPLAPCLQENPSLEAISQLEPVYHPEMNPVNSPFAIVARSVLQGRG